MIVVDLVNLKERGIHIHFAAIASAVRPFIAAFAAFADAAQRW